jgi:hypothetical protein
MKTVTENVIKKVTLIVINHKQGIKQGCVYQNCIPKSKFHILTMELSFVHLQIHGHLPLCRINQRA